MFVYDVHFFLTDQAGIQKSGIRLSSTKALPFHRCILTASIDYVQSYVCATIGHKLTLCSDRHRASHLRYCVPLAGRYIHWHYAFRARKERECRCHGVQDDLWYGQSLQLFPCNLCPLVLRCS